jgi:RNA polymerase sigma factor (sigma-70 family)
LIEERLLVENLQNESLKHSAFEMLVDAYKERLYWHIRRILLDHDDTDDVLQNTFIKCYENIDSFKGNSKLYSWLYQLQLMKP